VAFSNEAPIVSPETEMGNGADSDPFNPPILTDKIGLNLVIMAFCVANGAMRQVIGLHNISWCV